MEMGFFCQQCGECCSQMGDVFHIKEQMEGLVFLIYNQYTGEEYLVTIDPDKTQLFTQSAVAADEPLSCPFLRRDPVTGLALCTVHATKPDICRECGCWTMLILDSNGRRAGRLLGAGHFAADDPALHDLWADQIEDLEITDRNEWERKVRAILSREGYTVFV